jgi:hypothetical protein
MCNVTDAVHILRFTVDFISMLNVCCSKTKHWPHKLTKSGCQSWAYTHTWC